MKLLIDDIWVSDGFSLSGFKLINLFVGRNGSGKTTILNKIYDYTIDVDSRARLRRSTRQQANPIDAFTTIEGVKSIDLKSLRPPTVFLIDNFETGLHPSSIYQQWVDLIHFAIKHHVQVFAITYSNECIAALVRACDPCLTDVTINDLLSLYRVEYDGESRRAIHYTGRQVEIAIERQLDIL